MEYAIAAIQNAASAVGVLTAEGIVVATEKKASSKLLAPSKSSDKTYRLSEHCFAAVAGLTSDANILINSARLQAAQYEYTYAEPMPVESLVQQLADYMHSYTQSGGLRPFGVAFLYAGWDRHYGYQLYESDPSGSYRCGSQGGGGRGRRRQPLPPSTRTLTPRVPAPSPTPPPTPHPPLLSLMRSGWKATAIGSNSQSATATLKAEYKADMGLGDGVTLALKTLTKAMDTTSPSSEKVEVAVLTRDAATGKVTQRVYSAAETDAVLAAIVAAMPAAAPVPPP